MMRDPLEAKDRYVGVVPSSADLNAWHRMLEGTHDEVNSRLNHVLKREFKVLSMTADYRGPPDVLRANEAHFGRGYARPRMWEQYAEGHRGVCLLFSRDGLTESVAAQLQGLPSSRHGEVRYRSMTEGLRPDPQVTIGQTDGPSLDEAVEALVETLAARIFFEKYDDYASEQEYRFVVRSHDEEFLYVGFGESLRGVVLGAEFPHAELRPLLFQCAELGASLLRMSWRQGLGQLEGFYNPTIPLEHNHDSAIDPFRNELAQWHPTLAEYESR